MYEKGFSDGSRGSTLWEREHRAKEAEPARSLTACFPTP